MSPDGLVARRGPSIRRNVSTATGHSGYVLDGAVVAIVGSALVFNPVGYDMFRLPKLVVLGVAVLVAIASVMAGRGVVWHRVLWPLCVFLGVLVLSAFLSDEPRMALLGTDGRRFGVLSWVLLAGAFLVGMAMASTKRRMLLVRTLLVSSVPISLYALVQRLGWDLFSPSDINQELRPGSTFGSATVLGGFLALVVAVGASALFGRLAARRWLVPVLAISIVALLITQSRGGWIGAAVGVTLSATVHWVRSRDRSVLWALLAGSVLVLVTLLTVPGLASRAASLSAPTDGTAGGRFVLAEMGIGAVIERPVLGWGPDQSRQAMHGQIGARFEERFSDDRIEDRAHNVLIDVAIWGGLLGLAALAVFVAGTAASVWRQRHDWTVIVVSTGILAYAVNLLFNFPVPELDAIVWLFAGSLLPAVGAARLKAPTFVVGTVTGFCVVAILVSSLDALAADRHLRRGLELENGGNRMAAAIEYGAASAGEPNSALYSEVLTRFLLRVDDPAQAVTTARVAVDIDGSDPYLAELLAKSLTAAALGSRDASQAIEAEQILRQLIAGSPYDGSLHLELGNSLAAQSRRAEAVTEYQRAAKLIPGRSEPLRNLGLLAEQAGDVRSARRYFEAALRANARDQTASAGLARVTE